MPTTQDSPALDCARSANVPSVAPAITESVGFLVVRAVLWQVLTCFRGVVSMIPTICPWITDRGHQKWGGLSPVLHFFSASFQVLGLCTIGSLSRH